MKQTHDHERPKRARNTSFKDSNLSVASSNMDSDLRTKLSVSRYLDDECSDLLNTFILKETYVEKVDKLLDELITYIYKLPSDKSCQQLDSDTLRMLSAMFPIPEEKIQNQNCAFQFSTPTVVRKIGSYAYNMLLVDPKQNIIDADVAIQMPKELFDVSAKDWLNYRYYIKRAWYIRHIAGTLLSWPHTKALKMAFENGNQLRPYLLLLTDVPLCDSRKRRKFDPEKRQQQQIDSNLPSALFHMQIKIHFCIEPGTIEPRHFSPSHVNVKKRCLEGVTSKQQTLYNMSVLNDLYLLEADDRLRDWLSNETESKNSDIAAVLSEPSQRCRVKEIRCGIQLLLIWLRRRSLTVGIGSCTNFLMYYVYKLLNCKAYQAQQNAFLSIGNCGSSFLVFRYVIQSIANGHHWLQNYPKAFEDINSTFLLGSSDLITSDSLGLFNSSYCLSQCHFDELVHEARIATDIFNHLEELQDLTVSQFSAFTCYKYVEQLFYTNIPFSLKFDSYLVVDLSSVAVGNAHVQSDKKSIASSKGHDGVSGLISRIAVILRTGLSDRVQLLSAERISDIEFDICPSSSLRQPFVLGPSKRPQSVSFGLLLDPLNAFRRLDRVRHQKLPGNSVALDENEFSYFWGPEKTNLRRFQDGEMALAVVWDGSTIAERRLIIGHLAEFVLRRHVASKARINYICSSQLDPLLNFTVAADVFKKHVNSANGCNTGEESIVEVMQEFDHPNRGVLNLLRKISSDFSLKISSTIGMSPAFRGTETFPQKLVPIVAKLSKDKKKVQKGILKLGETIVKLPKRSLPLAPSSNSLTVLCYLEYSSEWPQDQEAAEKLKICLYVKLLRCLRALDVGLVLGLQRDALYVRISGGLVFRLQLIYESPTWLAAQEANLVKTAGESSQTTVESSKLHILLSQHRRFVLPNINALLRSLQERYGHSFSAAVRLVKRWVASQLLLNIHVPEEVIELLVAYLYVQPGPFSVPQSPLAGLQRFLWLVSNFAWRSQPLLVDFVHDAASDRDDQSAKRLSTAAACWSNQFATRRASFPPMTIVTFFEFSSLLLADDAAEMSSLAIENSYLLFYYCRQIPAVILNRLQRLALSSLSALDALISGPDALVLDASRMRSAFRPCMADFDVLIKIDQRMVGNYYQNIDLDMLGGLVPNFGLSDGTGSIAASEVSDCLPVVDFCPVQAFWHRLQNIYSDVGLFFCDIYGGAVISFVLQPELRTHLKELASGKSSADISCPKVVAGRSLKCCRPFMLPDGTERAVFDWNAFLDDIRNIGAGLVLDIVSQIECTVVTV